MDETLHNRVAEVFDEVVDLPPSEAAAALERLCAGDAEVKQAVAELLEEDRLLPSRFLSPENPGIGAARARASVTEPREDHAAALAPGARLGRYVLSSKLGQGGMGVVYLAKDPELGRRVAIKLLQRQTHDAEDARSRLLREAQAMARLSHPNVVAVYDVGSYEGQVFIAMEFVEGSTLSRWLLEQRTQAEALAVLAQAGRGLLAAHEAGLVHRDFKPDNVLVDGSAPAFRARVTDFGLARSSGPPKPLHPERSPPPALDTLTRTGALTGTPAYMALEQFEGKPATAATDIFSFCVVLWEALYGRRPFAATTPIALRLALAKGAPPQPASSAVPAAVRALLARGLSPNPAARPASMAEVLAVLEPRRSKVLVVAAVAAALLFAVALGALAVQRARVCTGMERELAGAWGATERAALQRAFAARVAPWAQGALAKTEALLDRYAADWVQMKTEACEDTRRRGAQTERVLELRTACLDLRRRELQSLVALLADAEPDQQRSAARAAGTLTLLAGCADIAALTGATPTALPALGVRVQAVRQRLAEARAQWNAGRRKVAEEQLVALLSESRALRWPPLIAESALQRARSANLAHHRDEAVEAAREAVLAAEESNLPRLAALAWSERAGAEVGMTAAQTAAATESISHAAALLRGAGGDAAEEAAIESVRGRILGSAYRPSEAEASYLKAAELYRKARNDAGAATALTNIGGARENQHKLRGAVEAHEQALVILRRIYDESHPLVHRAKEFLVYPLAKLGRLDEAEQLGKAALAAALANDLPYDAALARDGLSFIPSRRGHPSEGLPLARTALEGFEATLGPDNVTTAERRASLAELLLECGQSREALPLLRQTIETAIKQGAKELHASALGTLSLVLLDLGQRPQALETAREAVSRALESGDAEERVRSQLALGTILRTEDRAAAKAALAAAQAAMSMLDPPDVHVTEQATRLARSLAEEPR